MWYRTQKLEADWLIYVTDLEDRSKGFLALEEAGWCQGEDYNVRLDHVGFGVVQGKDGKGLRLVLAKQ